MTSALEERPKQPRGNRETANAKHVSDVNAVVFGQGENDRPDLENEDDQEGHHQG